MYTVLSYVIAIVVGAVFGAGAAVFASADDSKVTCKECSNSYLIDHQSGSIRKCHITFAQVDDDGYCDKAGV